MIDQKEAPIAGFVLGPDGTLMELTGAFADHTHQSDPLEMIVPADRERVRTAIGRCLGTGSATTTGCTDALEQTEHVEFRFRRLTDDDGRVLRVYGTVHETADATGLSGTGVPVAGDD